MTATSAPRCTARSCPVRYRSGKDRPCLMHRDDSDSLAARMDRFTALSAAPGEPEAGDDRDY